MRGNPPSSIYIGFFLPISLAPAAQYRNSLVVEHRQNVDHDGFETSAQI